MSQNFKRYGVKTIGAIGVQKIEDNDEIRHHILA